MKKTLSYFSLSLILLVGLYIITGEKASYEPGNPIIEPLNIPLESIDAYILEKERLVKDLKEDNEARVVWYDSISRKKTPYSLVYLHGFSASQEEGDPIHEKFAKKYGCNLFLSRLEDHGRLDSNTFRNFTPAKYIDSAKEAVAIGRLIGEKVIIMSCSTGGTLSAILAAHNLDIYAQIMYSPNIDMYDRSSELIIMPRGKVLAKLFMGGEYNILNYDPEPAQYWNTKYHIDGIVALKYLIETWMVKSTFEKINQPTFVGCFYKNKEEQDKVISIREIRKFYNLISTPAEQKVYAEFPNAGSHVISTRFFSKDIDGVYDQTVQFVEEKLGLEAVE